MTSPYADTSITSWRRGPKVASNMTRLATNSPPSQRVRPDGCNMQPVLVST